MNLDSLLSLVNACLPVWILTGGALVCLLVDAFASDKKAGKLVYILGLIILGLAIKQSLTDLVVGQNFNQLLFVSDPLSRFFTVQVLLVGFLSLLNCYSYLKVGGSSGEGDTSSVLPGGVVTLILFSVAGMIFLFSSNNLIVSFIGIEIMSLAIYVLTGSNRKDILSNEAAMKYFLMGSVASAILLFGIALLFATYGTFDLTLIASNTTESAGLSLSLLAVVMIVVGLFFKLAVAPFHFWTPDVYEGAPSPVTGFMATGVKLAIMAFLIKLILSFKLMSNDSVVSVLKVGVILSIIIGNLGALVQTNIKRMLAYSSISHGGFILMGLVVGFKNGQFDAGVFSIILFYLMGYSFMTLGAFGILSVMVQNKKEVTEFHDLKGLGYSRPVLAALFSLFMLSLMGMPPMVGFMAKYGILSAAVQNGYLDLAIVGVIGSMISAYYYLKALVVMYFQGESDNHPISQIPFALMFCLVFCTVAVIYLGLVPSQYLDLSHAALALLK